MKRISLFLLLSVLAIALVSCSCSHEETTLANVSTASCTTTGYTGDKVCNDCNVVVEKGSTIPALGHTPGEITCAVNATCTADGYSGDKVCNNCNVVVEKGFAIPALGHTPGEIIGAVSATCTADGYTGDVKCTHCGTILEQGEMIPMIPHVESGLINVSEPTCSSNGYTGEIVCVNCDGVLVPGDVIPVLEHQWTELVNAVEATCLTNGWSGERDCTVCGYHLKNRTTPRLEEHPYDENGVCTSCGWMKPGLYVDNELLMSWEDMVTNGYAVVTKGQLREIKGNMQMGRLVIGEEITYIDGDFSKGIKNDTLKEVWIPRSVTKLGTFLLYRNKSVTEVRMFCSIDSIEKAFKGAEALERVVLPSTLTRISSEAFANTPALKDVELPVGLEYIGTEAFCGSAITSITIPDTVTAIGLRAFGSCGLIEIKLPASLKTLGNQAFQFSRNLITVDMSACTQMTSMGYGNFYECSALTELLLPPNLLLLADGHSQLEGAKSLKHLAFPDGFNNIGNENFRYTSVESVVWPVSLIDAGGLSKCNLKTIYYRGSAAQWKMTDASLLFPDAEVIYNYTGE